VSDQAPTNYAEAMDLAMKWATGQRSHWSERLTGDATPRPRTFTECAQADAAEVEKWCAVARALAGGELLELAKNQPVVVEADRREPAADAVEFAVNMLIDMHPNELRAVVHQLGGTTTLNFLHFEIEKAVG
jgi:hypothetical protein